MSIEISPNNNETKGQEIKRLVEEGLSPALRERFEVDIVKDSSLLTKVRIRAKLPVREDGGGAEISASS